MTSASKGVTNAHYSGHWLTPPEWLAWVRATIGDDYFDPCPGDWTGLHPSGLEIPWGSRTFTNHPGSRGSTRAWWAKYLAEQARHQGRMAFVWAAFSIEQLRHMRPSPTSLPGWLILPRERVRWIWGGPDAVIAGKARQHGKPCSQPSNWSVFWSTAPPATPPVECEIVRTA